MTTPSTPAEVAALLVTDPPNEVLAAAKDRTIFLLGRPIADRVWMVGRLAHFGQTQGSAA